MSVLAELSIFPLGKGESLSPYVARAVSVIKESGLPHRLGPMGTSIEGEWDQILAVMDRCKEVLQEDCDRVYMVLKADIRKDGGESRLEEKVRSVEDKLG
jgi:uncharacterized protein (TIGR00106 family)